VRGTTDSGASVIDLPARLSAGAVATAPADPGVRARHDAFAAIVREHDQRLRTLAYQLLGERQAMDDVLQDVYVKAYRALPSFRGEASLSTWLYRIAYTTCIDRIRRRPALDDLPVEAAAEAAGGDDPDERFAVGEELRAALSGLDAEHRAAVLLVLRDGHSYDAAAEILGVPRGTVASRVARARRQLVRVLSEMGEGGPQ
jgi:RNA polymerase sigma-70 factor, ECF subfamily